MDLLISNGGKSRQRPCGVELNALLFILSRSGWIDDGRLFRACF